MQIVARNRRNRQTAWLGWLLMGLGVLVLGGTAVFWLATRLPDRIAIAQLPTPNPAPTTAVLAEAPTTTNFVLVTPEIVATLPVIATPELRELPSEASMAEAPTSMRQLTEGQPQRLVIPKLGVDAPVRDVGLSAIYDPTQGSDLFYQWQVPANYAAGWHHNSAPLGRAGNTVLNGHQNVYGEVFRDLEDLAVGDGLILYDEDGRSHLYQVTNREILPERGQSEAVRLENARWIAPTMDERVTIVTCWPYTDNSHRLVIVAKPVRTMNN
ncbi:MAG: sortase [Chloroflexi bacterium]|nr:sortase [Chloroflexota bacterium]